MIRSDAMSGSPSREVIKIFAKNLAQQIPRLSKGVFTSMMWTSLAIKVYEGPAVDRALVDDKDRCCPPGPLPRAHKGTSLQCHESRVVFEWWSGAPQAQGQSRVSPQS